MVNWPGQTPGGSNIAIESCLVSVTGSTQSDKMYQCIVAGTQQLRCQSPILEIHPERALQLNDLSIFL